MTSSAGLTSSSSTASASNSNTLSGGSGADDNDNLSKTKANFTTSSNTGSNGSSSNNGAGGSPVIFNEENFLKKLDTVTPTQDSIQTLALWIIHHKSHHDAICRLWIKKLGEADLSAKKRLALFYLANDVIQNCKRKNAKIFQDTFKTYLAEAMSLARNDSVNRKQIEHVLQVWAERFVYEKDYVDKLLKILSNNGHSSTNNFARSPKQSPKLISSSQKPKLPSSTTSDLANKDESELNKNDLEQIIAEFQPKKLCDSISSFESLIKEVGLCKASVEATRILDITSDHVKQYRDKSQCAKFKAEFENSFLKLEEYTKKLNAQANQRKLLIQLMEQSEIFYDAQFKDAKMVYNAYRVYGSKVHAVQKKLDELIVEKFSNTNNSDKLDNLDMEMSDEENNSSDLVSNKSFNASNSLMNYIYPNNNSNTNSVSRQTSSNLNASGSIRNNLDPRQNRNNSQITSPNNKSKSSSSSSSFNDSNSYQKRKSNQDINDSLHSDESPFYNKKENKTLLFNTSGNNGMKDGKKRERSNTPVRDEAAMQPPSATSSSLLSNISNNQSGTNNNGTNPLDFLTKFINKSSTNQVTPKIEPPNTSSTSSSSSNLSYLVSSLQKFVNGSSANNVEANAASKTTSYFDSNVSQQNSSFQHDTSLMMSDQRSATPTKDEIYQSQVLQPPPPPPPPPPQMSQIPPHYLHITPPPPPPPAPFHHQIHPYHHLQPTPSPPLNLPPPPLHHHPHHPHILIDPNSYHHPANFIYNQPPPPPPPIQISPHHPHPLAHQSYTHPHHHMISPTGQSQLSPQSGVPPPVVTPQAKSSLSPVSVPKQIDNMSQPSSSNATNENSSYMNNQGNRLNDGPKFKYNNFNKHNNKVDYAGNGNTFKRKYSNSHEDDFNAQQTQQYQKYPNSHNNAGAGNHHNKNQQFHQSNNRIPTINSQRDRSANNNDMSFRGENNQYHNRNSNQFQPKSNNPHRYY